MESIAEVPASRFDGVSAHRVWQLASLERAVLASLAESHDTTSALRELATGLERIAAAGTLASILVLDELSEGRLRHGAAPSLPPPFVAQIDGRQLGPRAGSCGTAAWRRSNVIVADIGSDPLWEEYRDAALRWGLRACWSVPILSTGGAVLGTFAFYYREPRAPAREDLVTIEGAARLARIVLERERSDRARRRAARRDQALFAAARVLARADDVSPALAELVSALGGALSWDAGAVWLLDARAGSLGCVAHWSKDDARFADFFTDTLERRLLPGEGLPGRATHSGEPQWLPTSNAAGFLRWRTAAAAGIHHGLAFPIRSAGEVLGAIELFTGAQEAVDADLLVALRTVGLQVGQFLSRARAQADRQRLIDELRETLRFSELFASILAHDLRNPLNTIIMGTQVLTSEASPRALSVLSRMQNSGARMARMIEQLLDLTRSREGNGMALVRDSLHLGDLASSMVNELALAFPAARIELQIEGDTLGQWDRDRLAQVLSNLIGNAIEHGEPNSTVTVRLDGHDPGGVTLETHNRGALVPEALPTLFDPFKPARPGARRSSGLGLGLYITRLIVTAHGGSIRVTSSSLGTRFHVQLPRTAAAESAPVARCA